ncbi:hypothetical protein BACSTE_03737 [Bacteroides stercoris ATCC 43183]|uniref:Uncharacterized protein n=1 Tax=Bacteroides stercoris ATCC 43183 TaxID=449673 RepID=B0NW54_BACSE|nr:hypothetical protein BACSTE_03737 [Bacteroides stercoris ATCC 43183]
MTDIFRFSNFVQEAATRIKRCGKRHKKDRYPIAVGSGLYPC